MISTTAEGSVPDAAARLAAFRALLDADLLRYYAIAAAMLGDQTEAQDAVHDAALVAWERFGDLRDPDRFGPWFDRILVNGCRDRLRRRRRRPVVELAAHVEDTGTAAPDHAGRVADAVTVERALRTLDADHVAVVVLRFEADLQVAEIARRLDIPEGTVKSRLHHALRRMRAALDADEEDAR